MAPPRPAPTGSSTADELERIREFTNAVMRGSSTEVLPAHGGFAVLNREFPDSFEHNCLVVSSRVEADQLIAEADRILGGAGLAHRAIELEREDVDEAWLNRFRDLGFEVHRNLTMVWRRSLSRGAMAAVERLPYRDLMPLVEASWRRYLPAASERTIRQLVDRRLVTHRACQVTHHAVRGPAGLAARCDLYRIPPLAQVEDVETEPEWRNRGYATAVVLDSIALARESGCQLIFLYADADDWPQQLYLRLGFDPVGSSYTIQRPGDSTLSERTFAHVPSS
ncbi:MAG: GNAT family N-acetyltransferase [Candidatus Dormibacteria bacterium]